MVSKKYVVGLVEYELDSWPLVRVLSLVGFVSSRDADADKLPKSKVACHFLWQFRSINLAEMS